MLVIGTKLKASFACVTQIVQLASRNKVVGRHILHSTSVLLFEKSKQKSVSVDAWTCSRLVFKLEDELPCIDVGTQHMF